MMALFRAGSPVQGLWDWGGDMSYRRISVLASVIVVFLTAFYSQAIPVGGQAKCSISPQVPCGPDDNNRFTAAILDANDASDEIVLRHCTLNRLLSGASIAPPRRDETIVCTFHLSTSATLESQHTLLRL
jgi:hypothetical protein